MRNILLSMNQYFNVIVFVVIFTAFVCIILNGTFVLTSLNTPNRSTQMISPLDEDM